MVERSRARESKVLYESLGFEVALRKVTALDFAPRCLECAASGCVECVIVYTRKRTPPAD